MQVSSIPSGFISQRNGANAYTAKLAQDWIATNCGEFIGKGKWPPNSQDVNPLDYHVWGVMLLQRVSTACYAEPCISYGRAVRPSAGLPVWLSVTPWHCVKMTQARITKSSLTNSSRNLVLAIRSSSRNSKGFTPTGGVKWEWNRKYMSKNSERNNNCYSVLSYI